MTADPARVLEIMVADWRLHAQSKDKEVRTYGELSLVKFADAEKQAIEEASQGCTSVDPRGGS